MLRSLFIFLLLLALPAGAVSPEDLLEPDQAFRFSARAVAPDAIEVRYEIAPGYYLYRDRFKFAVDPAGVELGAPELPPGKLKKDQFFGDVQTYRGEVKLRLPVHKAGDVGAATLKVTSQGCADAGVCYVPHEQKTLVSFTTSTPPAADVRSDGASIFAGLASADDRLVARLFQGQVVALVATFFGFGLLLAFTPCVLPMIPIVSGIIAGHGNKITRAHGFGLALAYVLGMSITYAIAGVLAGLSGALLSSALQNAWVLGAFAALFVLLAGSMLGFYELQLPATVQTRFAQIAGRIPGGHAIGVFVMGALSALIVGPCVAAPLAGALLYISQSGDVVLGGSALFAMALGMGVPLLAVGASAGALLPRSGPWMETVKRFFGVVLLGMAIYIVSPLLPPAAEMLAWALLLTITGISLRAIDALPPRARPFDRVVKALGVLALVAGVAFLIGALSGGRDVLNPLSGLRLGGQSTGTAETQFTRVASRAELDRAIAAAQGRPVMLDFYADWCVSCKEMERYTFSDTRVRERLAGFTKVQADVTANSPEHQALLQRFRLFGPPGIIFFDRSGRELSELRVIGFQSSERFAAVLDQVLAP